MTTNPGWYLDDATFSGIWDQVGDTITSSAAAGFAVHNALHYLHRRKLRGNIVDTGTGDGDMAALVALTLIQLGDTDRDLYLFGSGDDLARDRVARTGYPAERVHVLSGPPRQLAAATRTGNLALLRLGFGEADTITVHLEAFWGRLAQHGVLVVEDYDRSAVHKATDAFFTDDERADAVLLHPVDESTRVAVRSSPNRAVPWEARYDYRPPEFDVPDLFPLFPHLEDTDPATCPDPRLRRAVPHIWRTDAREPSRATGVISVEEAAVLHAAASTRSGRRGLEIGSHFGWSTAHLLAAGLDLDAIDPAFGDPVRESQVGESLAPWLETGRVRLWAGFSPNVLELVAASAPDPYGFAFIDGLHSNDGPINDVVGVEPHLSSDAMLVFHDLTFPDVASAVRLLKSKGWNIRTYNTMQVMAAAWREGPPPPRYDGDPQHPYRLPAQLRDLAD